MDILTPQQQEGHVAILRPTWTVLATVWAKVAFQSARAFLAAESPVMETYAVFTVRFRTDITTGMAIRYGTRIFAVQTADPFEDGLQWLEIKAREVTDIACST